MAVLKNLRLLCGILLLHGFLFAKFLSGQDNFDERYFRLRSAFVLNFIRYARFAAGPNSDGPGDLILCVVGDPEIGKYVKEIEGKDVGERKIKVQTGIKLPNPRCNVVFDSAEREIGGDDLRNNQTLGISLVITDYDGGMISLVPENDSLRFDVDQAWAESKGITFSSQLLKLARKIKKQGG